METPGKKPANKWLLGLGIGCGGLVVLAIIIGIFGYFFVRNMSQGFRDSQAMVKALDEKYGRAEAYVPDPRGDIGADRIEAFLAVREAAAPARRELAASLDVLAKGQKEREADGRSARNTFQSVRTATEMIPVLADFMRARSQALLDREMGLGEYTYLYVVVYYSWLKKSPDDGPGVVNLGLGPGQARGADQDALEMSHDMILLRLHRTVLPMLDGQLERLKAGRSGGGRVDEKWSAALEAEVKAMNADRFRMPWQDGLPETLARQLQPFRERLEGAYSRLTNIFELAFERR